MKHFIQFNNRNTWTDFGLDMLDRNVDPADVKEAIVELPHTHGALDFSFGPHGEVFFKPRPLMWEFGRKVSSKSQAEQLRYEIMRWAYSFRDGLIEESHFPSMQYKNAKTTKLSFDEKKGNYFIVKMEFISYPLRQSRLYEGSGLWDEFDFNNDVWQKPKHRLPNIQDQLPFTQLQIGDSIILGGWSQFRVNSPQALRHYDTERFYTIKDIRDAGDTDPSKWIFSGIQYQLEEDESWVRAQDVVQARQPVLVTLHNRGLSRVIPELVMKTYQSTLGGITIEHEGSFYNFRHQEYNDKFALNLGKNELKIYGQGIDLEFRYRKEVV